MFQDALAKLPQCHLDTLTYLLKHLYRVTIQSPVNLMHSGNIGVVFGPTLMRPGGDTSALTDIAESGTKSYCIEFMVRNCQLLFEKDEVIVSPVQVEKIAEPIAEPVDAIQVE